MARPLATLQAQISRSVTSSPNMLRQLRNLLLQSQFSLTSMKIKLVPKCLRLQQPEVKREVWIDEENSRSFTTMLRENRPITLARNPLQI